VPQKDTCHFFFFLHLYVRVGREGDTRNVLKVCQGLGVKREFHQVCVLPEVTTNIETIGRGQTFEASGVRRLEQILQEKPYTR
jgi:hypothetical protein